MKNIVHPFLFILALIFLTACPETNYNDIYNPSRTPVFLEVNNLKCTYVVGDSINIKYAYEHNNYELLDCSQFTIPVFINYALDTLNGDFFIDSCIDNCLEEQSIFGEILPDSLILKNFDDYQSVKIKQKLQLVNGVCAFEMNLKFKEIGKYKLTPVANSITEINNHEDLQFFETTYNISTLDFSQNSYEALVECNTIILSEILQDKVSYLEFNVTE